MTISLNLSGKEFINALSAACQRSSNRSLPAMAINDQDLDPNQPKEQEELGAPRIGHQAVLNRSSIQTMTISPPTVDAEALGDLSSVEKIDLARKAARRCASAYAQGMKAYGLFKDDDISQAKDANLLVIETFFGAAKNALAGRNEPLPIELSDRLAAFERACDLAGPEPSLSWKGALRDMLGDLPARQAMSILAASSVDFSVKQAFNDAVWNGRSDPIHQKFTFYKNGSFQSRSYASCDSASALAELALAPKTAREFELEHAFHRHYATTPDGEIHGFSNIVDWAQQIKAHGEAIAISSEAGSGIKTSRKLNL